MKLVYTATAAEVKQGDAVTLREGVAHVITSIEKPKHGGSTGRVYVRPVGVTKVGSERGYYPSVVGAHWIEREDQDG
jgi:hypothetical protein